MAKRTKTKLSRVALPNSDVNDLAAELRILAYSHADALREEFARDIPRRPTDAEAAEDRIRAALSAEIIPLVEGAYPEQIDVDEISREVSKKALMALKVSEMKTVLGELGGVAEGNAEELATKIGTLTLWDQRKIAELIIEHETRTASTRWFTSRVYTLRSAEDLPSALDRLARAAGQYVRVGVARWFVFSTVNPQEDGTVEVRGFHHGYQAKVDPFAAEGGIGSIAAKSDVLLRLGHNPQVEIVSSNAHAAAGAATALQWVLGIPLLNFVPRAGTGGDRRPGEMHLASEFMLDIVVNRMEDAGFLQINPTVAKFGLVDEEPTTSDSPVLEAVQFEGRHLLDSVEASTHIARHGRPLQDFTFEAGYLDEEWNRSCTTTVRVRLLNDHVLISSAVAGQWELVARAHSKTVAAVGAEIREGKANPTRLEAFGEAMRRIASLDRPNEEAVLFG